jgi:excisionase family DNA binding protein
MKPNTLSIPETARQLGVTLKYVYDLVQAGRLKAQKVAGRWRIPTSESTLDWRRRQSNDQWRASVD